jgi:hypothetical protein
MTKFVFDFTEGDKDQKDLLGGLALLVRDPVCSNGFPPKRRRPSSKIDRRCSLSQ